MESNALSQATLSLNCEYSLIPVATSFVESAANCYGLEGEAVLDLTLASEEIFSYLCSMAEHGEQVGITCRQGGYFVELEFEFRAGDFDLAAFNLTAANDIETENLETEKGLLIASRLVDRFSFLRHSGFSRLMMVKEKSYPSITDEPVPTSKVLQDYVIRQPESEELKLFVRNVRIEYDPCLIPSIFETPGKVVDMAEFGTYRAAIASDQTGAIGGGIIWSWENDKLVEFFGPYILNQPGNSLMPIQLVEFMISLIARTTAVGIITKSPSPQLPTEYFEPLGNLSMVLPGRDVCQSSSYYRHLQEDFGTSVWAHSLVKEFLISEYRRHVFARQIKIVTDEGENRAPKSVIATELDKGASKATLKPVWWGNDDLFLIEAHVRTLVRENLLNIFFEMDLGRAWECHFTPSLISAGFEPRLVLPYAGTGDILIFQYSGRTDF